MDFIAHDECGAVDSESGFYARPYSSADNRATKNTDPNYPKSQELKHLIEAIKNYRGAYSLQVKCVRLNFELREWHYQQLSGLRDLMLTTMNEMRELLRLEELAQQRVNELSGGKHG